MRTLWGTATDRGRVRALNEDALLAYPPVFLVADGMGGHDAGDVASRLVVEGFSTILGQGTTNSDEIHECFGRTARSIRETLTGQTAGTTVAGAALTEHDGGEYWLVFNIGDSRVYRLAEGVLKQISVDHSVVQELLDRGEIGVDEVKRHPDRHVITRAVGTGSDPDPDYWMLPAGSEDRLLICSDGLTSELEDSEIFEALTMFADPQQAAEWLVEAAVAAGGRDNVTTIVVDVASAWHTLGSHDVTVTRSSGPRTDPEPGSADWDEELHGATTPRGTGHE